MKGINAKSVSKPLSSVEMKVVTGGRGEKLLRCWCCGSGDEFFNAKSEKEAEDKCDGCYGCFEPD